MQVPTWSCQREYLLRQFGHANGFNAHPLGHANGNICQFAHVREPCVSGFVAHRGYDLIVRLHGHRLGGHAAGGVPMSVLSVEGLAGAGVLRPRRRRVGSIVPPPTLRQRASA